MGKKKTSSYEDWCGRVLQNFMQRLYESSYKIAINVIEEDSPIQIGEIVKAAGYWERSQTLRIVGIRLQAYSLVDCPGDALSFLYEGMPVKKNGEPMKNRKPIVFWWFIKNGTEYYMPDYYKLGTKSALFCRGKEYFNERLKNVYRN